MKKIVIRLLIILFIILALLGIASLGYSLYQKEQNKEIRSNFYKYILGNNFEKLFDYSLEENIINKINSENYNSKTKIEFSNSFKNNYNIDIDKFTIESDLQSNNSNQKNIISFDYSNNELFNLDIIQNEKYIGVKNQDVLNNYVGIKKENAKRIFEKINPNINIFYNNLENYNIFKDLKTNGNSIFSKSNNDYLSNIEKYIKSNKFVEEENVILKQDNGNVEVNANKYSLIITKQEFLNVYSVLTNMIVEDEDLINKMLCNEEVTKNEIDDFKSNVDINNLVIEEEEEIHALREESDSRENLDSTSKTYSTDSISESDVLSKLLVELENSNNKIENLKNYDNIINGVKCMFSACTGLSFYSNEDEVKNDLNSIFEYLSEYFNETIDDNSEIEIITYCSDDRTVKTSFLFGDRIEIDIDYINEKDNKYQAIITFLEKEEDNKNRGYTITFNRTKTNAIDNNIIKIELVNDYQIISKIEIKSNIEGTVNSNKFNNNFEFSYSGKEEKFSCDISNELNFLHQDVYEINSDNTLLLDDLEDNNFYYLINNLNSQIDNLYNDKISKLNIIKTNNSDKILQSNEQENIESENENEKNQIIDILIENISNEMGKAQNEGREYTLQDLKNLVIDGYEIEVTVSDKIAIIKIGNYSFKIDKDFNLSD